ncbi:MAG TPA: DUF4012 domain-containing protein [Ktedonobacterales bacterium]
MAKLGGDMMRRLQRMHPVRRALTIVLLVGVLAIPVMGVASAYQDYQQLRSLGLSAVSHLLAAKDAIIPPKTTSTVSCGGATSQPTASTTPRAAPTSTPVSGKPDGNASLGSVGIPDAAHLDTAQRELRLAQGEFRQLAVLLDRPNPTLAIAGNVPSVSDQVSTVRQLVYVGDDASSVGLTLLGAVTPILTRLHAGALISTNQPLITQAEATQLRAALVNSMSTLDDIEARVSTINPSALPINACQRAEFQHLMTYLPQARSYLAQAPALFDAAMWVAGVDHQRQFLVQTMDRAEVRPTGGFTGDYGILTTSGGRLQPFTLRDVDGVYLNTPFSLRPPAVYSWWPFPRWGLRDSNLSPDFPTTAQMNMNLFEGPQHIWKTIGMSDPHLDGVIMLTIAPIAHVLLVTGPITVPKYGDVVTADNLEAKIHYYQQDPAAIAKERALSPDVPTTDRKRFTYVVTHIIEDRVRHMSLSELLSLAKVMEQDMRSHEIQIYVTNPKIETMLLQHSLGSHLTTSAGQDSIMIDQANVSVSKASPYIDTTMQDNVVLDTKGGATHNITITMHNTMKGPYYGYSTYRDYVRVYVPEQATLQWANGFDTGRPVCWVAPAWDPKATKPERFKALPACPTVGFFPDGSLKCPAGGWGPGPRSSDAFGADGKTNYPVDDTGYPTNYTSDVRGRAVYGGFVTIPAFCTSVITLQYYVPNVALPSNVVPDKAPAYSYAIERQAGTSIKLDIHIKPVTSIAAESAAPVHYQATLTTDTTLVIPRVNTSTGVLG